MADSLKSDAMGFEVQLLLNPTLEELKAAVEAHVTSLSERKRPGLFYFSGHGAQLNGENFVIPHGAHLEFREDLSSAAFPVSSLVSRLNSAQNGPNLIFLDACRDCPLESRSGDSGIRARSGAMRGLAQMSGSGLLIGFAADSGKVALDSGEGSHYTNALLYHLTTPGISVADLLTRVRQQVRHTTQGRQEPFVYMGLDEIFSMVPASLPKRGGGMATPVRVTLMLDKSQYVDDEIPVIKVTAERDCHLGLYYKDAAGGLTQLFPNAYVNDTRVRGGEEITLMPRPDPSNPGQRVAIQIYGPPHGIEHFIAVATEEPGGIEAPPATPAAPFPGASARAARVIKEIMPERSMTEAPGFPADADGALTGDLSGPASASGVGSAWVRVRTMPK